MNGNHLSLRRCGAWLLSTALTMLIACYPLSASVVVLMNLEDLVGASDSIVQGVVDDVQSRWEDRLIFTYITLRIEEPLKGERSRTLVIRQLGGQVGSLVSVVSGMPEFEPAERVIAFLKDAGNGTFHVVGLNQGRYVIADDHAVSNLSGVDLMDPKNGIVRGVSTVKRVPVEELKNRIRALAE